jgi:signal transduction histidine kinase
MQGSRSESPLDARPGHGANVWVVDDVMLEADLIRRALERDFDVDVFHDPSSALEALSARSNPDVLVLDWQMPEISGIDVCRFLRSRPSTLALPILMLTVHTRPDDVAQGIGAGANDYLRKPFQSTELVARVSSLVRSKQLVDRVESAERDLRSMLMELPDALIRVDEAGRLSFINDEAARLFTGRAGKLLLGTPLAKILPSFDLLEARRSPPGTPLRDIRIGERILSPSVRHLSSGHDETTILLHDVTDKRRAELRRLDFYSMIAHDLRNPLQAMSLRAGLALMRLAGKGCAGAEDDVRHMQARIGDLVSMVNDFLDLARMDATGMRLETAEHDPADLIERTIGSTALLAAAKNVTLRFARSSSAAFSAELDPKRFDQVLSNLLSNAIKFTPDGGVVEVSLAETQEGFEVAVSDTGQGIAEAALATLFQRYSRAVPAGMGAGGTGLGLLIVREIVEAHGGTVTVESQLGAGSTFRVRMPRTAVRNTSLPPASL